jgi:hypothetical protein
MKPDRFGYTDYWIFTMQMSQWRYAKFFNFEIIDITAKSGIKAFAPEWENLMRYKRGEMGIEEYSQVYLSKLIRNFEVDRHKWESITQEKTLAITCYCRPGEFCHRHLFTTLLGVYLKASGQKVTLMGELTPHPNNKDHFSNRNHHEQPRNQWAQSLQAQSQDGGFDTLGVYEPLYSSE